KTFTIGDTLVFNFANGQHNVAKVTKSAFDACNGGGTTLFTLTDSPASVSLNQTGQQYFICTVGGHCSSGQKLAINVTRKASTTSPAPQPGVSPSPRRTSPVAAPAPQPATPPPTPAPAPASSTGSL
ncbi:hypothetical protein EI017_25105, partial [Escherichia coli]|nr:hypothetical protein [Escherichia coli]